MSSDLIADLASVSVAIRARAPVQSAVAWFKIDDGLMQLATDQLTERIASQGVPVKDG